MYVFNAFQVDDLPDIFAKIKAIFEMAGNDSYWVATHETEGPIEGQLISPDWTSEPMRVLLDGREYHGSGLILREKSILIRNEFQREISPLEYLGRGLQPQPTWLSVSPSEIVYRVKMGFEKGAYSFRDWRPPKNNEYVYEVRQEFFQGQPYDVVVFENVMKISRVR